MNIFCEVSWAASANLCGRVLVVYFEMCLVQNLSMSGPDAPEDLTKKKKKDPKRLKKPKSAFLLWCKEHRQKVHVSKPPNLSFVFLS